MPFYLKDRGFVSLFIILTILFLITSGVGVVYLIKTGWDIPKPSTSLAPVPSSLLEKAVPATPSVSIPPVSSTESPSGRLTQNQLQNTQDSKDPKRDLKCLDEIDLWQYLPEDLKKKTYKQGIVTSGQSTYDIFPLAWSKSCQRQAFLIELVGRGADAYTSKDFEPRGLYIFDNKTQQIKLAYLMPTEFTLDEEAYESNFWFTEDKYIFVVTTKKTKKEFISRRYEYDVNLGKIQPSGE